MSARDAGPGRETAGTRARLGQPRSVVRSDDGAVACARQSLPHARGKTQEYFTTGLHYATHIALPGGPEEFRAAAAAVGLELPVRLIPDGRFHRFSTRPDRPRDDAGWYVWHGDHGAAGDWRRAGAEPLVRWAARGGGRRSDAAEIARLRAQADQARAAADRRNACRRGDAAREAQDIWAAADSALTDHGYLAAKGVQAHGLRVFRGAGTWRHKIRDLPLAGSLIIPLRDAVGQIQTLEFVGVAGGKRFLPGGRKQGCYYTIPGDSAAILLAEGYATGASLHEATGYTVVCAMDATNLRSVAQTLRAAHPDALILLAGDHDASGTGQRAAEDAARAVGGIVAVPADRGRDWNDVHQAEGPEAVRATIDAAIRAHIQGTPEGRAALTAAAQPVSMHTGPRLTAALVGARTGAEIQTESVEAARARIRAAVQSRLDALRDRPADALPAPSLIIRITTGAGKTSSTVSAIINDPDVRASRVRILYVVTDHAQAGEIVAALKKGGIHAVEYYGRSAPLEHVAASDQPDTTCLRMPTVRAVGGQHHPIAAACCRTCVHGQLAASLCGPDGKAAEANAAFLATCRRQGIDPESVQPCWVFERAMRRYHAADVLVMPYQAYTDKLTRGELNPFGGAEHKPCLVVIDEGVPLMRDLTVRLADIEKWTARTRDWADRLHRGCDPQAAHPAIFETFRLLSAAIWECGAKPDTLSELRAALEMLHDTYAEKFVHGGTWAWESVRWAEDEQGRETGELDIPLRALESVRAALAGEDAAATWTDQALHITELTALAERVCEGDTVLLDATIDDRTTVALRNRAARTGRKIDLLHVQVRQHMKITHLAGRSYAKGLRTAPWYLEQKDRNTGDLTAVLGAISVAHRDGQRLWGVITQRSLALEDAVQRALEEFGGPVEIGYWGRDERAHNRWSQHNLILLGLPWPSPQVAQSRWDRLRALDPALPMHPPAEYAAELVAADVVQALGRGRAIYADPHDPIQVIIAAHVTPELRAALGKYGLRIAEERRNPLSGRAPRDKAAILRVLVEVLDRWRRGGHITSTARDTLERACRQAGLRIASESFRGLLDELVPPTERGGKRYRDQTRYALLLIRRAREALRVLDTAVRRAVETVTQDMDTTIRPLAQRLLAGLGDLLGLQTSSTTGPPAARRAGLRFPFSPTRPPSIPAQRDGRVLSRMIFDCYFTGFSPPPCQVRLLGFPQAAENSVRRHRHATGSSIDDEKYDSYCSQVVRSIFYGLRAIGTRHGESLEIRATRLRHGISQAIVRHVLTHRGEPQGGWVIDRLIGAVAGPLDSQARRDARRRLREDAPGLVDAGVTVRGDRVHRLHPPDGVAHPPDGVAHPPEFSAPLQDL